MLRSLDAEPTSAGGLDCSAPLRTANDWRQFDIVSANRRTQICGRPNRRVFQTTPCQGDFCLRRTLASCPGFSGGRRIFSDVKPDNGARHMMKLTGFGSWNQHRKNHRAKYPGFPHSPVTSPKDNRLSRRRFQKRGDKNICKLINLSRNDLRDHSSNDFTHRKTFLIIFNCSMRTNLMALIFLIALAGSRQSTFLNLCLRYSARPRRRFGA
jgi:hypothetical protein